MPMKNAGVRVGDKGAGSRKECVNNFIINCAAADYKNKNA